jgi:hypothetical protein
LYWAIIILNQQNLLSKKLRQIHLYVLQHGTVLIVQEVAVVVQVAALLALLALPAVISPPIQNLLPIL